MIKNERIKLICMGCKYREINVEKVILCGLTKNYPNFVDTCPDFSFYISDDIQPERQKKGFIRYLNKLETLWIKLSKILRFYNYFFLINGISTLILAVV